MYRACRSTAINRVRSLGKGGYIQPRKCVHSHRGGPESWPPEPVWVTFLFQMKQIKNRVNPITFLKKNNAQNDVCVYNACRRAAIMLSVLCSGTTRGGWGAWVPSSPKWVGHTNCSNPMSSLIGGAGQWISWFLYMSIWIQDYLGVNRKHCFGLSNCKNFFRNGRLVYWTIYSY